MVTQATSAPLAGVVVVDASTGLAGPAATRWLADLGADVVHVEPPAGDPLRRVQPAAFASWHRGKRSIRLDPRVATDRAGLDALLAVADVFVHGWTSRQAKNLGLGVEPLGRQAQSLIVASVTPYPVGHPDEERPGDELLVQARLGAMDEQEARRPGPMFIRMPFASWGAAHLLTSGIAARLLERERTGRPRAIHTSLLQGALAPAALYWQRAERPPAWMAEHTLRKLDQPPHVTIFECRDGRWLQVMGEFFRSDVIGAMLEGLGLGDLRDERVDASNRDRWTELFRIQTAEEWTHLLWPEGVICMPALEVGEILGTEQARLNGYAVEVEDPDIGHTVQAGPPFAVTTVTTVAAGRPARPVPQGGPLAGLRVLDFGSYVAGPFGAQCLADLGADVIKIEPPGGEKGRQLNQFTGCQRGKRTLALDLRHPRRDEVLAPLVASADVVTHNVRLGAAVALGIDEASLRRLNPRLVFGHSSGYGERGEWRDLPAFDPTAFALSGWARGISGPGQRPSWLRMSAMDCHAGLATASAIVIALYQRARTGRGALASTSLMAVAVAAASETVLRDGTPVPVPAVDGDQTGTDPWHRIYEVADGWVAVSVATPGGRAALADVLGPDPRCFAEAVRGCRADDLRARLEARGVPAEVVATDARDRFFDAELASGRGLVRRIEATPYGWFENPGGFWSGPDGVIRNDGPIRDIGADTRSVLGELGLVEEVIDDLLARGVVSQGRVT